MYLGVGPEQNFTYIAALKPRIAFIVDIRSGNRDLHLMYKALFELAADRAEFVSLLFSRARPAGLPKDVAPADLLPPSTRSRRSTQTTCGIWVGSGSVWSRHIAYRFRARS